MWKENARPLDQLFGKQISHTIPKGLIPFKCIRSNHSGVFYKAGSLLEAFCRKHNASCSIPMVEKLLKSICEGLHFSSNKQLN